ncbi:MAG TPA: HAMP domain-containing sensor histidine kinase, partial [Bacillota bacterium]
IAGTAREIGRSRDFQRRVAMDLPDDEVGQLASEFNQMLDRIAEAYDEKDRAYRQARDAYEAQRRFAADASHELRTPLTVLQANLELLQDDRGDPAERQEALADMQAEVQRMSRLVSDLLVLARADAGKRLELRSRPLRPSLEAVVHRARAIRGGRAIDLVSPLDITMEANPDALEQLLWILVENAVKYTGEDGRITVSAGVDGGDVVLRVVDDGIGIEPDQQERVFERFYRAPRARAQDGSGLGLAIARWIVDQHHGRIDVSSRPGEGSEFVVRLPAKPPAAGAS